MIDLDLVRPTARRPLFGALAVTALLAVGCGTEPKPEPQVPSQPTETAKIEQPPATPPSEESVPNTPDAAGVKISDEIAKACGITEKDAFFAFNSAKLRPEDTAPLDKLVPCFNSGPMKDRKMKLVGHADPRGDSDYNIQLGLSRADSVAKYLFGKGLDKAKASTTSRGAMDASGTDEKSWALDRRVDVMLAD